MAKKASIGIEEEGNTDTSSSTNNKSKQPVRRKFYCGTLFKYEEIGIIGIENRLREICKKYILGKETCPTTGNKHLQIYFELNKPMRITELKIPGNPHLEACLGTEEQNTKYCQKENDYIKYGFPKPIKIIDTLYPWQKNIEDIVLGEVNERTIYWFYDTIGNKGKSALVKYLVVKYNCLFCQGGKESDIMNLVFNRDMDSTNCVIFDIPRAHKGNVSYASLENIKNGLICNTKYETGVKIFNSPHIICFANFPPSKPEELSNDRWCITCLNDDIETDEDPNNPVG